MRVKSYCRQSCPNTSNTSTWVRVMQRFAGPGMGWQFIPRVGQEVLVDFMDGAIERPIVIAAFCNGSNDHRPSAQGNCIRRGQRPGQHQCAQRNQDPGVRRVIGQQRQRGVQTHEEWLFINTPEQDGVQGSNFLMHGNELRTDPAQPFIEFKLHNGNRIPVPDLTMVEKDRLGLFKPLPKATLSDAEALAIQHQNRTGPA